MRASPRRGRGGGSQDSAPIPPGMEWSPAQVWLRSTGFGAAAQTWNAPAVAKYHDPASLSHPFTNAAHDYGATRRAPPGRRGGSAGGKRKRPAPARH